MSGRGKYKGLNIFWQLWTGARPQHFYLYVFAQDPLRAYTVHPVNPVILLSAIHSIQTQRGCWYEGFNMELMLTIGSA